MSMAWQAEGLRITARSPLIQWGLSPWLAAIEVDLPVIHQNYPKPHHSLNIKNFHWVFHLEKQMISEFSKAQLPQGIISLRNGYKTQVPIMISFQL